MLYHRRYGNLLNQEQPASEAQSSNPQPVAESQTGIPVSSALALINSATGAEALLPLPTVGKGASKAILASRPENGYSALSELPQAIFEPPYNCKLSALESWEG